MKLMVWDCDPCVVIVGLFLCLSLTQIAQKCHGEVWGSDEVNFEGWKPLKRLQGHESSPYMPLVVSFILTPIFAMLPTCLRKIDF